MESGTVFAFPTIFPSSALNIGVGRNHGALWPLKQVLFEEAQQHWALSGTVFLPLATLLS